SLSDGQVGVAYPIVVLNAAGGAGGPYTITQAGGAVPQGMTYTAGTRTLAGTPGAAGVFSITFNVTDSANQSNVQTLVLRVGSIPTFTSPYRLLDAALNKPYNVQLTTTGGAGAVTFTLPQGSSLPSGMSISPNGAISGTPTVLLFNNFVI